MGIAYVEGWVEGEQGKKESAKFLVDSGTTYTLLPKKVWRSIGLKPKRTMQFSLADGTTIERKISEAYLNRTKNES